MPLLKRKSKGAFEHNLKAEMHAGKPQPQALAIAYSVKRKAKKASGGAVESGSEDMNMAKGGQAKLGSGKRFEKLEHSVAHEKGVKDPAAVAASIGIKKYGEKKMHKMAMHNRMAEGGSISASTEKRPMPDDLHDDTKETHHNSGKKALEEDSWTDQPTVKQAQKNNGREVLPIKRPKMVPTNAFSTRLYDEEGKLQESASPGPYGEQPPHDDDEEDATKMGKSPDMAKPHTTAKAYAEGGKINEAVSFHDSEEDEVEHPAGLESDDDQERPAEHDYMSMRDAAAYADGGEVSDEEELEHAASIAAAIMAKMRKKMARGGAILSEDSMETTDDDQADLARNAEEDANMEDKSSFDALRKENYSEEPALHQLDSPENSAQHGDSREDGEENIHDSDIVSAIRRKMKIKSAITR